MYNQPPKVLNLRLNSIIDTLPLKSNLYLWGETFDDKCGLRTSKETLLFRVLTYSNVGAGPIHLQTQ